MTRLEIRLREWDTYPKAGELLPHAVLEGVSPKALADLASDNRLVVSRTLEGVRLTTSSYVGRITLGDLAITITPKVPRLPLLTLLRYAYGLRGVTRYEQTPFGTEQESFLDLVIGQLCDETHRLLVRGLHRSYTSHREELSSPRGRLDFGSYANAASRGSAGLLCIHHLRTHDIPLNRILLAGLHLASRLCSHRELRFRVRDLSHPLSDLVGPVRLSAHLLNQARHQRDRRTRAYDGCLALIDLLYQGQGPSMEESTEAPVTLPGFLFDMNRFFQTLLSRFFHEHLKEHTVVDEYGLRDVFAYDSSGNPKHRRAPSLRPDFVLLEGGSPRAMLDAKYRDLWSLDLPSSMLYQLAMYALSNHGGGYSSTILYPTTAREAREQKLHIRHPTTGQSRGRVILRPVPLLDLSEMLQGRDTPEKRRSRQALALALAYGPETPTGVRTKREYSVA